jgi:hypothetical protein
MKQSPVRSYDLPFANDTWPAELRAEMKRIRRKDSPPVVPPYSSHLAFPSGSNPFVNHFRTTLADRMAPFVEHRAADLPFLDRNAISIRSRGPASTSRLVSRLGMTTAALLTEFGRDLFRLSRRAALTAQLHEILRQAETEHFETVDHYKQRIAQHEICIAQMTRDLQQRSAPPILNGAVAPVPYRFIDIKNARPEPILYRVKTGDHVSDWQGLNANEVFTYGVRHFGPVTVMVDKNERTHSLHLTRENESYSIVID